MTGLLGRLEALPGGHRGVHDIDDVATGDYHPGYPDGAWLRAEFHTGG